MATERSGGSYRTRTTKPHDHTAGHQVTGSTQFHADNGAEAAQAILRGMYDPAPNVTGRAATTHD